MYVGVVVNTVIKSVVSELSRDGYRAVRGFVVEKYNNRKVKGL
jgi:hypothetical protein